MRFDGKKMRAIREKKGLSLGKLQAEMARLHCDVSYQTLSLWERGETANPGYVHVVKMAEVLGEDPKIFFADKANRTNRVSHGRKSA